MCSACITSSPRGVEERGRAVVALLDVGRVGGADQHRAHLLAGRAQGADQDLQRDRVEPAHRGPGARAHDRAAVVDRRRVQPGGRTKVASGSSKTPGPSARCRRRGSPRRTGVSTHSPPKRTAPRASLERGPPAAATGAGAGPGDDQREADVDELDLAVGVAVAVALLVGGARSARPARPGRARAAPAPAARTPGRGSAARRRPRGAAPSASPRAGRGDQLADLGGDPLGAAARRR